MDWMRVVGLILILGGGGLVAGADYISKRVEEGRGEIEKGQRSVDSLNSLFSVTPMTREVGRGVVTDPAQRRIDEGREQVAKYTKLAEQLQMGGVVIAGIGCGLFFVKKKKKRRKR